MSGAACNRLDLQGLADYDAETRSVKPKLRPKAETRKAFCIVLKTSSSSYTWYMYTQRSAHVFTETRSIHFAQPRVAVAFRSQLAGAKASIFSSSKVL